MNQQKRKLKKSIQDSHSNFFMKDSMSVLLLSSLPVTLSMASAVVQS
jgi:hypothetical protein